jgi:hypothetical protein
MRPTWFIALAVVFALVLCGSAVAGPKHPNIGDPDIVEGIRTRDELTPTKAGESPEAPLLFDFSFLGKVFRIEQEPEHKSGPEGTGLSAAMDDRRCPK